MGEAERSEAVNRAHTACLHVYDVRAAFGPGPEPWTGVARAAFWRAAEGRWTCAACSLEHVGGAAWVPIGPMDGRKAQESGL